MSKNKLLRCILCLLMGLVCSVGWAQTAELQVSTIVASPEHLFTMKNGYGYFMSGYTSPTESQQAMFAFFDDNDDATTSAYKIYCVTSGKWLSYTKADSYDKGVNQTLLVDDQASALAWHVASATNNSKACYQISPYKTDGTVASIYMNWYQGTDSNPLDNTSTMVGFYGTQLLATMAVHGFSLLPPLPQQMQLQQRNQSSKRVLVIPKQPVRLTST